MTFIDAREHRRSHSRGKLAVLGVAVGISLLVAAQAINASVRTAFRDDAAAMAGSAELIVLGGETGFPEAKVAEVRRITGVSAAVPMIVARVRLADRPVVLLGVDRLREAEVRAHGISLVPLGQEDSVLVAGRFARTHGQQIGAPVDLMTSFGTRRFTVRGLLPDGGVARAHGGSVAVMDIDAARVALDRVGLVDRIDVRVAAGQVPRELAARIEETLGPGYRVESSVQDAARRTELVAGYQGALELVALLALLVGMCLVAHTIALSAAERRRELAIRRRLGVTRTRIVMQLVGEAALMGLLGGIIGLPLALIIGRLGLASVSASMTFMYATPIDVTSLRFQATQVIVAVPISVVASALAALVPALRAAQVSAQEAFNADKPANDARGFRMAPAAGLLALTALAAPVPVWAGAALLIAGTGLAAPWLVELLLRGVTWLAGRDPLRRVVVLRLASESLPRELRRTARATLALVAGLMFIVIAGATHASVEADIDAWEVRTLRSDVIVTARGRIGALQVQPLAEDMADELDAIPGVDVADGRGARAYRFVRFVHEGQPIALKAMDPQHPQVGSAVFDVRDRPVDEAMRALFESGEPTVMVSENFVRHFGQRTGQTIDLDTPSGRVRFRVVGVVVEFASPIGVIYLNRARYRELWHDRLVTAFMVEAKPGVSRNALHAAIASAMGDRGVTPVLVDEIRAQTRQTLDESFVAIRAVRLAAFLIGLLGLSGALVVTLLDRIRELTALLRSGVTRRQVLGLLVTEATLLGSAGGVIAMVLGAYVSYVWAVPSMLGALGWQLGVRMPLALVGLTVAIGVAVGLTAGLLSARRAADLV